MTKVNVIGCSKELINGADMRSIISDTYIMSGRYAGTCYGKEGYTSVKDEELSKSIDRANRAAKMGHHSVFQHSMINMEIECPKIIAMILNSIGISNTSEKSARYTKMEVSGEEKEIYEKWVDIIKELIFNEYDMFTEQERTKLAQENARYMISVFTPTSMVYSLPFRNVYYLIDYLTKFRASVKTLPGAFNKRLYNEVDDLIASFKDLFYNLNHFSGEFNRITDNKNQYIRFMPVQSNGRVNGRFIYDTPKDYFGDTYSVSFYATFAQVAQEQRHRTTRVKINFAGDDPMEFGFYTPKIIFYSDRNLRADWENDMRKLQNNYPQGLLVNVVEQGLFEDFALKCKERLCGRAQLEIMEHTGHILSKFVENKHNLSANNINILNSMTTRLSKDRMILPRCEFPDFTCNEYCKFKSCTHSSPLCRLI